MAQRKQLKISTAFILGLLYISIECDARAVNISNTWTMPQEGLNVFYRFFRDRISWFEADAVCQFHHANLVTVDNSFQFDATRDLLRELDVNDIVWIGLMRPQSSERFMWSNSRPLAADTGYWAESLPLMDAPLCAVIDPIRDYRWHALRCGGPETASFLCEMPVPSWADACIIKDLPSMTMQYMADTASIELIRNCGEEGLLRQSCRVKEDRERVINDLICPKERYEAQRINDMTSSHFRSLQLINSIPTDNNENNDIELLPMPSNSALLFSSDDFKDPFIEPHPQTQTEKNTVQRLIEQFNVDELMQADQASSNSRLSGFHIPGEIPKPVKKMTEEANDREMWGKAVAGTKEHLSGFHIPGEIPKPVKKMPKKLINLPQVDGKKQKTHKQSEDQQQMQEQQQQKLKQSTQATLELQEMMMGDQPAADESMHHKDEDHDETSNEIEQPLPHIKKVLPHDFKKIMNFSGKVEKPQETKLQQQQKEMKMIVKNTDGVMTTTATTEAPTTTPKTTTTTTMAKTELQQLSTTEAAREATTTTRETTSADNLNTNAATDVAKTTTTTMTATHSTTMEAVTIGHPMHPQQQTHSNAMSEEMQQQQHQQQHVHMKESSDSSHFIPPMLLVKSHYVPPAKHELHEHEPKSQQQQQQEQQQHQHLSEYTTLGHGREQSMNEAVVKIREQLQATATKATQPTAMNTDNTAIETELPATTTAAATATPAATRTKSLDVAAATSEGIVDDSKKYRTIELLGITTTATTEAPPTTTAQTMTSTKAEEARTTTATTTDANPREVVVGDAVADDARKNIGEIRTSIGSEVDEAVNDLKEEEEHASNVAEKSSNTTATTTTTKSISEKSQAKRDDSFKIMKEKEQQSRGQLATNNGKELTSGSEAPATIATTVSITTAEKTDVKSMNSFEDSEKQELLITRGPLAARTTEETSLRSTSNEGTPSTSMPTPTTTPQATPKETAEIQTTTVEETSDFSIKSIASSTTTTPTTTTIANSSPTPIRNFLKATTVEPFKPNRRRLLTKPETSSYIKRVLG